MLLPPDRLQIVSLDLDPGRSIYEEIKESCKQDESLGPIKEACKRGDKSYNGIRLQGVRVQDCVLFRDRRLWVPEDWYITLLTAVHVQPMVGHPGRQRMIEILSQYYY